MKVQTVVNAVLTVHKNRLSKMIIESLDTVMPHYNINTPLPNKPF
jgi:hypothetical protein